MEIKLEGQTEWGWKIAAYLFLAGVGAGAYAVGIFANFTGWTLASKIGIFLGFPLLFIGTFFLIADLGVKPRALRAFMNPKTSWIARGTFIISIFMILGAIHTGTLIWPFQWLKQLTGIHLAISIVNFVFAILTMIYTGILLGASRPIALWSTAMLPLLFLVSGLSTGALSIIFFLSMFGFSGGNGLGWQIFQLAKLDILLIFIEFIVIFFYIQATHRTEESRASASLMIKEKFAPMFWIGIILIGMAIPLVIELIEISVLKEALEIYSSIAGVFASLCGLSGGYLLRYIILACGVRTPLRAAGIEFTFSSSSIPRT
ncbi:MAG: NrfD/PsrC family molybdoenzyme membrane anchor subunit [Acidobacteriota bacterium]